LKKCWLDAAHYERMSYVKMPYLKGEGLVDFYECALDKLGLIVDKGRITVE